MTTETMTETTPQTVEGILEAAGVTAQSVSKYVQKVDKTHDLSEKGVSYMANIAQLTIESCEIISNDNDNIVVQASARSLDGRVYFGICEEKKARYGVEKATTRAQRNARRGLLPQEIITEAIAIATNRPADKVDYIEQLEGRLEIAKGTYLEQKAEIERLTAEKASFEGNADVDETDDTAGPF